MNNWWLMSVRTSFFFFEKITLWKFVIEENMEDQVSYKTSLPLANIEDTESLYIFAVYVSVYATFFSSSHIHNFQLF